MKINSWLMCFLIAIFVLTIGVIMCSTPIVSSNNELGVTKNYNTQTKTATITKTIGGDKIAEVKLITPQINYVIAGKDRKVAEFTIQNFEEYSNVFEKIDFYNNNLNQKKIYKSFSYKYKTSEEYQVDVPDKYKEVCEIYNDITNGTGEREVCHNELVSWKKETRLRDKWILLTSELTTLPKGNITIGIFTDVKKGESVEWIPTLFGSRINEWAIWTESLNVNIKAYYSFEDNLNDVATGNNDLTDAGTVGYLAGKIGKTIYCDGGAASYASKTSSDFPAGDTNRTLSFWVNSTDANGGIFGWGTSASTRAVFATLFDTGTLNVGTYGDDLTTTVSPSVQWQFITVRHTAATNRVEFYYNGVNTINKSLGGVLVTDASPTALVCNIGWGTLLLIGEVDEVGVWSRVLSNDEIIQLYNGGDGITWSSPSMDATPSYPADDTTFLDNTIGIGCNFTGLVNNNVTMVNLTVYNSSNYLSYVNSIAGLNKESYNATWTTSVLPDGSYNWSCFGYGASGVNGTSGNSTFTVNTLTPIITNVSYRNTTIEGSYENFLLYVTYDSTTYTSSSANLIYNNTVYNSVKIGSGNSVIFNKSINVPIVSADKNISFYWELSMYNGTGLNYFNSTIGNQTVNNIGVGNCSVYSSLVYNFTLKDEDTQVNLPNTAAVNSTVKLDLNFYSSNTNELLYSYSAGYNKTNNVQVCLSQNLTSSGYSVTGVVEYGAEDYVTEFYNFQRANITSANVPQNINLYDLLITRSTEFLITFKDESLLPVKDALAVISRRYVDEGTYKTVEIPITDSNGQTIAHLVASDVLYTISFIKNGILLASFPDQRAICQTPTTGVCQITLNALSSGEEISTFETHNGLSYSVDFNSTGRLITLQFVTLDGSSANIQLNVSSFGSAPVSICSSSISSASGTLFCNIPNSYGNLTLQSIVYKDGVIVDRQLFVISALAKHIFGGSGVFFAVLLFMTIPLMMIGSNIAMLIGGLLGILLVGGLMFINGGTFISIISAFGWLAIAVFVIIWKLNQGGNN